MLWAYGHLEAYCFFYPGIDTKYSPGFKQSVFNQVVVGTTAADLERKLGKPLLVVTNESGSQEWSFTDDGKCWWGDFAWLHRAAILSNGIVVSIERSIRYD